MSNGNVVPATAFSVFTYSGEGSPPLSQLVIGDQSYSPSGQQPNASFMWLVVVDLTNLKVVANDVSTDGTKVPTDISQYAGNPQYFLYAVSNAAWGTSMPQGDLYALLQKDRRRPRARLSRAGLHPDRHGLPRRVQLHPGRVDGHVRRARLRGRVVYGAHAPDDGVPADHGRREHDLRAGAVGLVAVRLVAVGVWLPGSGFTRVLEEVLGRLGDAWEPHLLGIGYRGPVRDLGGWTLHPTNLEGGDVFAAFQAARLVEQLDARVVLLVNDLWMLHAYMRTLPGVRDRARVVAYVPLDGRLVDSRFLPPAAGIDRLVTFTRFAKAELEAFVDAPVDVIPHGVDTETFRPLGGEPDGFVVLNANRPLERKRIDLTIEGFALFARGKPSDVRLRLHHALDGDNHAALDSRLGIGDRVDPTASTLSDTELNLLYNSCHVGVNTAMGEGWGLVSFEHGATGAAQVVPGSSACAELWEGSAEVVPAEDTGVPGFSPLAMRTVTAAGVADALERLYSDPEHLRRMSAAAYENATQPHYRWDAIGAQWRRLFDEVLAA